MGSLKKLDLIKEPYRLFFPIGVVSSIFSIMLWIFFQREIIEFYPKVSHGNIMFFVSLWSFVVGFLMTAIPRMTGSKFATRTELFLAIFLLLVQMLLNTLNLVWFSVVIFFMQVVMLLCFLILRFLQKRIIPFEGFVFFPFAFLQVFLGLYYGLNEQYSLLHTYAGEAFLLNLIVGIGSRLIPVLSRLPGAISPHMQQGVTRMKPYLFFALNLNVGLVLQFYFVEMANLWIIGTLILIYIYNLKIFKKTTSFTLLGLGLKVGLLFFLLGYLVRIVDVSQVAAANHLLYVGGILLITLMVATRVGLAHSGQSLDYELHSKELLLIVLSISLAAILRFVAQLNLSSWEMLSSIYLISLALTLWLIRFIFMLKSSLRTHSK